jgi:hypothetical protein
LICEHTFLTGEMCAEHTSRQEGWLHVSVAILPSVESAWLVVPSHRSQIDQPRRESFWSASEFERHRD